MARLDATAPQASGPATPDEERPPRGARRRSDALRNRAAILAAATTVLRADPDASVAQIAQEAAVGRVTLYGHFSTRAELIDAALLNVLDRGNEALGRLDLTGEPAEAFYRLVTSSWRLLDESRSLLAAAQRELPHERIRALHHDHEVRVRQLLERGQHEGAFRSDLPVSWLLATTHAVLHGATDEVAAGRLDPTDAGRFVAATLSAAFAPQD